MFIFTLKLFFISLVAVIVPPLHNGFETIPSYCDSSGDGHGDSLLQYCFLAELLDISTQLDSCTVYFGRYPFDLSNSVFILALVEPRNVLMFLHITRSTFGPPSLTFSTNCYVNAVLTQTWKKKPYSLVMNFDALSILVCVLFLFPVQPLRAQ